MPRITAERREARRAEIIAAARRCFARQGFHQTSMPDIAAEAGLAVGASYRYFAGKDELIAQIAGDTFDLVFEPVQRLVDERADSGVTVAELVTAMLDQIAGDTAVDRTGAAVPVEEMLRCAVQAWSELPRNERLQRQAEAGFDRVRSQIAAALRLGQRDGTVRADLHPEHQARAIMATVHGLMLQRVAFGLSDVAAVEHELGRSLGTLSPTDASDVAPAGEPAT